jgi:glucose-6-phosphate dehydrogenase assembly protein OpcA
MVAVSSKFEPIELSKLERIMADLKSKIGESNEAHASFTTQNAVVIGTASFDGTIENEVVLNLMRLNPARFFLLEIKPGLEAIRLSARCELVSAENKVCSEVIRIEAAEEHMMEVASILRSHLLTGVSTDLFIADVSVVSERVGQNILALCERVIFDGRCSGGLSKAAWLGRFCQTRIDLEWLRLVAWRESVRLLFEIPGVASRLSDVEAITIYGGDIAGESLGALYMAGWILGCLKFEVRARGAGFFECRGPDGGALEMRFAPHDSGEDEISALKIEFKETQNPGFRVDIKRKGDILETLSSGVFDIRSSQLYKDMNTIGLLQRFFLVGTSVYKYDVALRQAIDMENLKQGYRLS